MQKERLHYYSILLQIVDLSLLALMFPQKKKKIVDTPLIAVGKGYIAIQQSRGERGTGEAM